MKQIVRFMKQIASLLVVFLVGAERTGVPADATHDVVARIPQASGVDSLNAAMAGAVALYEARRQRGA